MLLVLLHYKVSEEEIQSHLKGHIAFLEEGYSKGYFITSGRMLTGRGGVILSPLTRRGELEQFLKQDPFIKNNLVSYELIAFEPSRFHPDFAGFIQKPETRPLEVVPYQSKWKDKFEEEAKTLSQILGKNLVDVHHIGSTAIPDIHAKPTIDILLVVKDIRAVDQVSPEIVALGYKAMGEFGMPGRRLFTKDKGDIRLVNVHVFEENHPDVQRHLTFRDYMRTHPEDAKAYSKLKQDLAEKCEGDIEKYSWGKEDFIKAIDIRARLWRSLQKG